MAIFTVNEAFYLIFVQKSVMKYEKNHFKRNIFICWRKWGQNGIYVP